MFWVCSEAVEVVGTPLMIFKSKQSIHRKKLLTVHFYHREKTRFYGREYLFFMIAPKHTEYINTYIYVRFDNIIDCIIWPHDILINYYRPTYLKNETRKRHILGAQTQLFCSQSNSRAGPRRNKNINCSVIIKLSMGDSAEYMNIIIIIIKMRRAKTTRWNRLASYANRKYGSNNNK